jgi:hypothetical protein
MHLHQIYALLNNRMTSLVEAKKAAIATGEIDRIVQIDSDILSTQSSISQIRKSMESDQT